MNISRAIKKINPNAKFKYDNDDINTLQWLEDTTPISISDIQAQFTTVEFDMAMADLRQRRNAMLKSCDWVMLSDSPIADKTNWETYRQSLRDITENLTTVEQVQAVEFPTKP